MALLSEQDLPGEHHRTSRSGWEGILSKWCNVAEGMEAGRREVKRPPWPERKVHVCINDGRNWMLGATYPPSVCIYQKNTGTGKQDESSGLRKLSPGGVNWKRERGGGEGSQGCSLFIHLARYLSTSMVVPVAYGLQLQLPRMSGEGPRPWEGDMWGLFGPFVPFFCKMGEGHIQKGR